MFSGIIKEKGIVQGVEPVNGLKELAVLRKELNDVKIGDSISVNGSCLTVVKVSGNLLAFEITLETLAKTNLKNLKAGDTVNLEPSLRLNDKIDGHFVSGHIDDTGEVLEVVSMDGNKIIRISFPERLSNYIAPKGSVSVNGVSLTVIDVEKGRNCNFTFTLIPYTAKNTNLGVLKAGDTVNLEADLISRYIVNYFAMESNKQSVKV